MDALNFQLAMFKLQQVSSECLRMLLDVINRGSMPSSCSNDFSSGESRSDILISHILKIYIVCDVCALRPPSFGPSSLLFITLTKIFSMNDYSMMVSVLQLSKLPASIEISPLRQKISFCKIWLLTLPHEIYAKISRQSPLSQGVHRLW